MTEKYYKISEAELLGLLSDQEELKALWDCGVDNWEGWDEAHNYAHSEYYDGKLGGFNIRPRLKEFERIK